MIFLHFFLAFLAAPLAAQLPLPANSISAVLPTYLLPSSSLNDYNLFANGGPDSNWYIGFNNAWIVKLPPAPEGNFTRAFIGAKIGRAKTKPNPDKPWLRDIIEGKIYMAISQTPAFSSEQSYFLAETSDLPREPDPHAYVADVGASEWFWAEIPLSMASFTAPNYLIIWSPTPGLTEAANSPILAASDTNTDICADKACAWNNHSILGVPPRQAEQTLETPLSSLYPALALKLVPPQPRDTAEISVTEFSGAPAGKNFQVQFSADGRDIDQAWVEVSQDQLDWEKISSIKREPPFIFTLTPEQAPKPGQYLRGAARNISGVVGYSSAYAIPFDSH